MLARRRLLSALALSPALPARAGARVLRVGPSERIRSLAAAASLARDGDRIEVQAGDYVGDVAAWERHGLQLVAVGGRARLLPEGAHARGKGIFVVSGEGVEISGFDFIGARVPDTNGAGIRFERGSLTVRDCLFTRCETGLLSNNDPAARLTLEGCEFSHGHREGRFSHLLYVGSIASLNVSACYFHHGELGHLLKSRAARNLVRYNRLTDEADGSASYELEFPNGGQALVLGNLIEQGPATDNPLMISFGAEGYRSPAQQLTLVHNTLVNRRPGDTALLRVARGTVALALHNNLIAGPGHLPAEAGWALGPNPQIGLADLQGYALPPASPLRGTAGPLPPDWRPTHQYLHPCRTQALSGPARDPGALQQV
jgi:hypothetical protein